MKKQIKKKTKKKQKQNNFSAKQIFSEFFELKKFFLNKQNIF